MLNALNTAATGMNAQTRQVEVISNNIANSDTVGYKQSRADFQDLLYHNLKEPGAATSATTLNPTGVQIGAGTKVAATTREFGQGSLRPTERDLDVAVDGNGFLAIQRPDGEIGYTRDGSLRVGPTGRLENADGYPMVPEIVVPPEAGGVEIGRDGRVSVRIPGQRELTELGQLQLVNFANPSGLNAVGGNIYISTEASGAPVPGTPGEIGFGQLHQRFLEASNVSPITEMTGLIRAQRTYELNSKVISSTDQMLNTLNGIR